MRRGRIVLGITAVLAAVAAALVAGVQTASADPFCFADGSTYICISPPDPPGGGGGGGTACHPACAMGGPSGSLGSSMRRPQGICDNPSYPPPVWCLGSGGGGGPACHPACAMGSSTAAAGSAARPLNLPGWCSWTGTYTIDCQPTGGGGGTGCHPACAEGRTGSTEAVRALRARHRS